MKRGFLEKLVYGFAISLSFVALTPLIVAGLYLSCSLGWFAEGVCARADWMQIATVILQSVVLSGLAADGLRFVSRYTWNHGMLWPGEAGR